MAGETAPLDEVYVPAYRRAWVVRRAFDADSSFLASITPTAKPASPRITRVGDVDDDGHAFEEKSIRHLRFINRRSVRDENGFLVLNDEQPVDDTELEDGAELLIDDSDPEEVHWGLIANPPHELHFPEE